MHIITHTDTCTFPPEQDKLAHTSVLGHTSTCSSAPSLSQSHTHTLRRGSARCSVRPASVLCWLLRVLVQHVLLMTLIQARFLHCVWAPALSYRGSLTRYTWAWACEITRALLLLWHGLALVFSTKHFFLIIDDAAPCQAVWACVALTLALLSGWDTTTRYLTGVCLGGRATP